MADQIDRRKPEVTIETYRGPIPPATFSRDWNALVPDAAERILRMTEKEGDHRRSMEREEQRIVTIHHWREMVQNILGQVFAFLFLMTLLGGGFYLITIDKEITGLVSLLGGAVSIVGMFIVGKYYASKK